MASPDEASRFGTYGHRPVHVLCVAICGQSHLVPRCTCGCNLDRRLRCSAGEHGVRETIEVSARSVWCRHEQVRSCRLDVRPPNIQHDHTGVRRQFPWATSRVTRKFSLYESLLRGTSVRAFQNLNLCRGMHTNWRVFAFNEFQYARAYDFRQSWTWKQRENESTKVAHTRFEPGTLTPNAGVGAQLCPLTFRHCELRRTLIAQKSDNSWTF